jgi:hypothetical protein
MYNVREKLRAGEPLSAKEKLIHEQGLVAVLASLHDDLDAAVLEAYGWGQAFLGPSGGTEHSEVSGEADHAALLERLAALNAARAEEEARGQVRWLRPAWQCPAALSPTPPPEGEGLSLPFPSERAVILPPSPRGGEAQPRGPVGGEGMPATRLPWPATLPEQVAAVAAVLAASPAPLTGEALAARFAGRGAWKKRLPQLLDTLVALGRAREVEGGYAGR